MLAVNRYDDTAPLLSFNIVSVLDSIKESAGSLTAVYRVNKTLAELSDLLPYMQIDGGNVAAVEETLSALDDTIDDVKTMHGNIFYKLASRVILSKMLTIQFTISNKLADYELEHC